MQIAESRCDLHRINASIWRRLARGQVRAPDSSSPRAQRCTRVITMAVRGKFKCKRYANIVCREGREQTRAWQTSIRNATSMHSEHTTPGGRVIDRNFTRRCPLDPVPWHVNDSATLQPFAIVCALATFRFSRDAASCSACSVHIQHRCFTRPQHKRQRR